MKRFVIIALALLTCSGIRAQNLLPNGGFENSTVGWANFWGQTGSLSKERSHAGNASAQVTHAKTAQSGWLQPVSGLEIGAVYRAEVYAFRTVDTITAFASMHTASQPYLRSANGEKMRKVGVWELLTVDIAARPNGEVWVHLCADGVGTVWFDDATLTLVKTRAQRKTELLPIIDAPTATAVEKAQACLDLGEVAFGDGDLPAAARYYHQVLELAPNDRTKCRNALSDLFEMYRRHKEYAQATAARREIVERFSALDTVEGAQDLSGLAEALGEEADHLPPDYAGAITRLNEALALYSKAGAIYKKIDAVANKNALDILDDRLVVTRYDINEDKKLGKLK